MSKHLSAEAARELRSFFDHSIATNNSDKRNLSLETARELGGFLDQGIGDAYDEALIEQQLPELMRWQLFWERFSGLFKLSKQGE